MSSDSKLDVCIGSTVERADDVSKASQMDDSVNFLISADVNATQSNPPLASASLHMTELPMLGAIHKTERLERNESGISGIPVTKPQYQMTGISTTINTVSIATQTYSSAKRETPTCARHESKTMEHVVAPPALSTPTLCESCSRSMLSYVMLMQQFLDEIAVDISHKVDPLSQCAECVKENLFLPLQRTVMSTSTANSKAERHYASISRTQIPSPEKPPPRAVELFPSTTKGKTPVKVNRTPGLQCEDQFLHKELIEVKRSQHQHVGTTASWLMQPVVTESRPSPLSTVKTNYHSPPKKIVEDVVGSHEKSRGRLHEKSDDGENNNQEGSTAFYHQNSENQTISDLQSGSYSSSMVPLQTESRPLQSVDGLSCRDSLPECVDGILSAIYKVESGLGNVAKAPTVWDRIEELQHRQPESFRANKEAFVTMARNDVDVLGCLVLGASLLLCGTNKTLCVLVADAVSPLFMAPLSSVFHVVQHVRSLDSLGTTKLSLLDQPELGISFIKLNVWRLKQFTKCVFLAANTVVVQNCDELFCHDELSAVPDVGWPDCFNSAVFVYRPSIQTFWDLLEFAESQGSFDGGDQGLLNTYFTEWSHDIHKKLSFIYNLMANVSYTYTPAFKQFGRNVKIVQFMGSLKPWHVKFYSDSGQISPSSTLHPTYIQFVHVWVNVFRVSVLPLLSQEIQKYASSENIISSHELLRFFPSSGEAEDEFLLTPLSVRLRPSEKPPRTTPTVLEKLQLSHPDPEINKKKSPTFTTESIEVESFGDALSIDLFAEKPERAAIENVSHSDDVFTDNLQESETLAESNAINTIPENPIPGSAVGNYLGMSAWEQGRMDYEGNASSDTIIKRLHYLMEKPDNST